MGTASRPKPKHLAKKLLQIREALGLSQNEMIRRLGFDGKIFQGTLSAYERGLREPALPVLLSYAQAVNVYVDTLIDDGIELPSRLPSPKKSEGIARATKSTRKR